MRGASLKRGAQRFSFDFFFRLMLYVLPNLGHTFTVPVLSNRNRVRLFFRPTFHIPPRFDGLPVTHREESPLVDRPSGLLLVGGLPRLRRAALSAPPPTRWTILRGLSPSPLTSSGLSYFSFPKRPYVHVLEAYLTHFSYRC